MLNSVQYMLCLLLLYFSIIFKNKLQLINVEEMVELEGQRLITVMVTMNHQLMLKLANDHLMKNRMFT